MDVLRRARADLKEHGQSAAAHEIPARYAEEAVGRTYANEAHITALARLVFAEENLGGQPFAHLDIYAETDRIAQELEATLGRPPSLIELTNTALHRVHSTPETFPTLSAIAGIFRELAGLGSAEPEPGTEPDYLEVDDRREAVDEVRFVTFVERFSLSSCIDGCPACVGAPCDLGHPSLTRNLVSRRLLRALMRTLLDTQAIDTNATPIDALAERASQLSSEDSWVILRGTRSRTLPCRTASTQHQFHADRRAGALRRRSLTRHLPGSAACISLAFTPSQASKRDSLTF